MSIRIEREHLLAFQISFPRGSGSAPRAGLRAGPGGLENRWPSQGGPRVRIPPPPLKQLSTGVAAVALYVSAVARCGLQRLFSSSNAGAKWTPSETLAPLGDATVPCPVWVPWVRFCSGWCARPGGDVCAHDPQQPTDLRWSDPDGVPGSLAEGVPNS